MCHFLWKAAKYAPSEVLNYCRWYIWDSCSFAYLPGTHVPSTQSGLQMPFSEDWKKEMIGSAQWWHTVWCIIPKNSAGLFHCRIMLLTHIKVLAFITTMRLATWCANPSSSAVLHSAAVLILPWNHIQSMGFVIVDFIFQNHTKPSSS